MERKSDMTNGIVHKRCDLCDEPVELQDFRIACVSCESRLIAYEKGIAHLHGVVAELKAEWLQLLLRQDEYRAQVHARLAAERRRGFRDGVLRGILATLGFGVGILAGLHFLP